MFGKAIAKSQAVVLVEDIKSPGRRLLALALLIVLLLHGTLLANGSFINTYDALIHIFFASHYAESWFDPWEPRWYTGFLTVSYPPLVHYLIAALSRVLGLLNAFAVLQIFALLSLVVGMYRFCLLLASPRAAGFAAILLALSSSIAETTHLFGQLPTLLSLSFLLNAIPYAWRYLEHGRWTDLLRAVLWLGATTAGHHVTTLFGGVFFLGPMVVTLLLLALRLPRPDEPGKRIQRGFYRLLPRLYRSAVYGACALTTLVLMVLPYWIWSASDPIAQVPIPHGSRENFFENPNLGFIFWVVPWISTILFFPYMLYKGLGTWRWPFAASILLLTLLGTGGTTPLPKLLLGGAFEILTLDRFTFWATMLILPFAGMAVESAVYGRVRKWLDSVLGGRVRTLFLGGGLVASIAIAVAISTLTTYRPFQPDPIDITPIISFIEKDEHWRYRYLTLGFGDQMAWLSANTRATTPDGNYHSARRLPELTTTPVERLEGAKFTGVPGIGSLQQFVGFPEKYNLKFIFSNDEFYDPLLHFYGWHRLDRLENGIQVWERENIPPLPERLPRRSLPVYQAIMWGVLPISMFVLAFLVLLLPTSRTPHMPWQRQGPGATLVKILGESSHSPADRASLGWAGRFLNQFSFHRQPWAARLLRSIAVLLALVLPLGAAILFWQEQKNQPEQIVLQFWDDMAFRRFAQAYSRLEPDGGLDYDRWLLELSLQGGLLAGYAELDAIEPELISVGERQAVVRVKLSWVTALESFEEEREHRLVRMPEGWRIIAQPSMQVRPRERFVGQSEVTFYRAPRRLSSVDTAPDRLDQPHLTIANARLVRYEAGKQTLRYAVIGELQNMDARPADLTITAILRDSNGEELVRENAHDLVLHKLLPGERTPFRIDFGDLELPASELLDFDLSARAVVTGRELARDLATWSGVSDGHLEVRALNLGTREATVPQALLSLYDEKGIAWVNRHYLLESVLPRQVERFEMSLKQPPGYRVLAYHEPVREDVAVQSTLQETAPRFPLDGAFTAYLLQMQAFYREAQ